MAGLIPLCHVRQNFGELVNLTVTLVSPREEEGKGNIANNGASKGPSGSCQSLLAHLDLTGLRVAFHLVTSFYALATPWRICIHGIA